MKKKTVVMALFLMGAMPTSLSANPSVQCWGSNSLGQTQVPADLTMGGMPTAPSEVRVARGLTCALDSTARVSCWGTPSPDVAHLTALTGVKTFSISQAGACALAADGVHCFSAAGDSTFEAVPTLQGVKSVSVGGFFACALDSVGVHCWGGNDSAVTTIPTFHNPRKLIASMTDACALDDVGVQCWGDSGADQVLPFAKVTDFFMGGAYVCAQDAAGFECSGNTSPSPAPAVAAGAVVVGGLAHICSLDQTGVHCSGDNSVSQLQVPTLSHPKKIFADATGMQTCALDDSGLVCWGEDQAGQSSLGPVTSLSAGADNTCVADHGKLECWGGSSTAINTPLPLTDAYQVVTGSNFSCAMNVGITSTNSCWGGNTALQSLSPALPAVDYVQGLSNSLTPSLMAAGFNHACVTANTPNTTELTCFGNNDYGQSTPPTKFIPIGNSGSLSAGGNHTCGIDSVQGLACWGENEYGESTPPTTLVHPRQVSAGFFHSCALDDNGVTCWGRSEEGQITVPKLVNPRSIQAGGYHTCALDDLGVTCWGSNYFGQATAPANLAGLGRKITAVTAGMYHTCVATQ